MKNFLEHSSKSVPSWRTKLLRQGRSHSNELRGLIARTAIETAVRKTNSEDDQDLLRKEVCSFVEWIECWIQFGIVEERREWT